MTQTANGDVSNKLLAWTATGIGALIVYSAVKNRFPLDVLRDIQGPAIHTASAPVSSSSSNGIGGNSGSSSSDFTRVQAIANRTLTPQLVPIKPSGSLDFMAAAALDRAQKRAGFAFGNVGSYRPYALQSALFHGPNPTLSDGTKRFADPNKSLHVVGLAIDIADSGNKTIADAMSAEGWVRAREGAEQWHWSYLVRG